MFPLHSMSSEIKVWITTSSFLTITFLLTICQLCSNGTVGTPYNSDPKPIFKRSYRQRSGHNHHNYDQSYHFQGTPEVVVDAVEIPYPVQVGQDVKLRCVWRVGSRGFYSMRWYKDDKQFYSYIKGTKGFSNKQIEGVTVDMSKSDDHVVALTNLLPSSEGTYKCEIMSEGPQFKIFQDSANLTVVELANDPVFYGLRHQYMVGDTLNVTCSAENGRPAPVLELRVNDVQIHEKSGRIRQLSTRKGARPGLLSSYSQLLMPLSDQHIPSLKLGCYADTLGLSVHNVVNVRVEPRQSFFGLFGNSSGKLCPNTLVLFASKLVLLLGISFW